MMTKGEMSTPVYKEDTPGISGLESYVDTGEGEGMDRGVGAAKEVLMMGATEAMKELGTGDSKQESLNSMSFIKLIPLCAAISGTKERLVIPG